MTWKPSGQDFVALVIDQLCVGTVADDAARSDVPVVADDVVDAGMTLNEYAAVLGDIVFDGAILAGKFLLVITGQHEDGGDLALGLDVIALDEQTVDAADAIERKIGVARVVQKFAVLDGAVDVGLVHQAFAIVDAVAAGHGDVAVNDVIIALHRPAIAAHLHGAIVIG